MKLNPSLRTIFLIWLAWSVIMVGYQAYVQARLQPQRPDNALAWTPNETTARAQNDNPYLIEPFLNNHVSWDSEYYISIALAGYDDPDMRALGPEFDWATQPPDLLGKNPGWTSMNYAFFPFYPMVMGALKFPLFLPGLNPIATASLAGVLVSLLGTLGAMIALYYLARDLFDEATGLRAAFYLLIYPASMFLAQIYTEGLFLGLTFGALALAKRDKWLWAALLAACAAWTRPGGALLVMPLALYWLQNGNFARLRHKPSLQELVKLPLILAPVAAFLLWNVLWGTQFRFVEDNFFGRGLLLVQKSADVWGVAWQSLFGDNPDARAYYLVEFAAIAFGLLACVLMWRKDRVLVLYSLALIVFSVTSGVAQGMHRYVMAAPVIFLLPASWGRSQAFDRAWTVGNVLLMGVFAAMFSYDMWAG